MLIWLSFNFWFTQCDQDPFLGPCFFVIASFRCSKENFLEFFLNFLFSWTSLSLLLAALSFAGAISVEASESCSGFFSVFSSLESLVAQSVMHWNCFSKFWGFSNPRNGYVLCQDSVWSPGFSFSSVLKIFFPFFARLSLSSFFWAWSFTLGVGSQFSQIGLGQFEFSGSFGIFQLRHRRSRRMDRWPLFPRPCKKGLFGFLRSFLVRFWSLPKNLWTTCMLISGLSFKLLLNRKIFLPFGPVRKFRIRILSTGCFFVCLWGCFPLILSPESRKF